MYNFTRTVTIKNGTSVPKAIGYSMELTGYVNKTYGLNMRCGIEMFGATRLHWQVDIDSLDKISAINVKLLEDKNYWSMIEKGKEFFLDGSVKDSVVNFPG